MNTKKTREPRRRNSVLRNQALIYIAIIITGIILISALYNTVTVNYYRSQTTELAGNVLRQAEAALQDKVEQYRHIIGLMYLNPALQNLLFNEYYYDLPRVIARRQIMTYLAPFDSNLNEVFTEISNITLYVSNKTLGEEAGSIIMLETVMDQPWALAASQEKIDRCLWLITQGAQGEEMLSAVHPMRNLRISSYPGNFLGYAKLDFNREQFFHNILAAADTGSEWLLVTGRDGSTIASTLGDGEVDNAAWLVSNLDAAGWKAITLAGRQYLVSGVGVKGTDWTCWYAVSEETLSAGFRLVNLPVLLLTIGMTAAMAIAAWFAASRLARRIGRLADAMTELERGRFDVQVKDSGHDEVAFLATGFNHMAIRLDEHVTREYRDRMQLREFDLQALQAQLHPHFLYNSLASISWLGMQSGCDDIPAISNGLARFYRLSLSKGKNFIRVQDEVDQARAYLDVMSIRYRGKITTHFHVREDTASCWTLKLILQPFVENALLHGLHVLKAHINLIVSVESEGGMLVWKVIDDGVGIPADQIPDMDSAEATAGYGIANVHRRIRMYFGVEYGVKIMSEEGIGTAVMIKTPLLADMPE